MTHSEAVLERLKTEAQLAQNAGDKPILERSFRLAIAEIERMRAALKELSDPLLIEGVGGYGFQRALRMINTMRDIAKTALEPRDQQSRDNRREEI